LAELAITSYLAYLTREGACYNSRLSDKSKESCIGFTQDISTLYMLD